MMVVMSQNLIQQNEFRCDAIQVINLDRSITRWDRISKHLNETGQPYQRFKAVDGYHVVIKNMKTGHIFTGLNLKNKKGSMEINATYKIYCDGDSNGPVAFNYEYYKSLGSNTKVLSAGEYGCWCSHFAIWQEAKKHQCANVIVIEDDVIVKQNLTLKLLDLLERAPSYDLFMMDPTFFEGDKHYLDEHKDVAEVKGSGYFWGTSGYAISVGAITKLTDSPIVTGAIDNFLDGVARKRLVMPYNLSVYMSSDGLVGLNNDPSEICVMGRGFEWNENGSHLCNN